MIKNEDVPSYKAFTHESEKKRKRRHAKENREAAEADQMKKEIQKGEKMCNIYHINNFNL